MKAAVLEAFNQPLAIKEVADPNLSADGVILKLEATGVCRSDWHGWNGDWKSTIKSMPHILGHEMSGVVAETGANVTKFKRGDRVIVPFTQADGVCPHCMAGHHNVCDNRTMIGFDFNGGFASHTHIPNADRNLIALPDGVDFISASAMGCRFMTAYHGVLNQGRVRPGEWVAVYGAGGVGLSAIQIAAAAGANVVAVDIADDKLDFAKQMGAVATVNSKQEKAFQAVREITKGGANVSVDALGIQDTCTNAILSLGKRGRHVQIGLTSGENGGFLQVPVNYVVNIEAEIIGSVGMPLPEYASLLQMVESGRLQPAKLVTKQIALEDINAALQEMNAYTGAGVTMITKY